MIAEQIQQHSKYYQFHTVATILEQVIDCYHTIVNDEMNPCRPPLTWLISLGRQLRPQRAELFHLLFDECSPQDEQDHQTDKKEQTGELSEFVRSELEKCSVEERKMLVSKTKDGCSPLFMACKSGHYNIAKYLLDVCGADIEQKGRFEEPLAPENPQVHSVSPLWIAAVSGHLNIVKLLIDYKADIDSVSNTGSTPLRSVCYVCRVDDEEPDLNQELLSSNNVNSEACGNYMNIVRLLVESGADVNQTNYSGVGCLINSIHNCNLTVYILDHGGDIDAVDDLSMTALLYAIMQKRFEVTKLLLDRGANPMIENNNGDDALSMCCILGLIDVFQLLLDRVEYSRNRIIDAYKLLGASILELKKDESKVRDLWNFALNLQDESYKSSLINYSRDIHSSDSRRAIVYSNATEFTNTVELASLTSEDLGIQSLLITERCLGPYHNELFDRLIYRGKCYYSFSSRPDLCLDFWIYALKLKVKSISLQGHLIFKYDMIHAARNLTRLLLEMAWNQKPSRFKDFYDVVFLFINMLDECKLHFKMRPIRADHQEIYDLLLGLVLNLLYGLDCVADSRDEVAKARELFKWLIKLNPHSSNGSPLLHVCLTRGILSEELIRPGVNLSTRHSSRYTSPRVVLIKLLVDSGHEVDLLNEDGLTALQLLCLTSVTELDKTHIANFLVEKGAHVDRRLPLPYKAELVRQELMYQGVIQFNHVSLSCLAARKLAEMNITYDDRFLSKSLKEFISIH